MALDLNKLNKTAANVAAILAGGGNRPHNNFWKPSTGKNQVRIMPEWNPEGEFAGQFWREVYQHWNVNEKGPVTCPNKTPGLEGACPICELVEEMKDDKDPVVKKAVKDIRAKVAFMVNVQALNDMAYKDTDVAKFQETNPDKDLPFNVGEAKIQFYAAPTTVFNGIISAITDGGNDVTDLKTGNVITIQKMGSGLTTKYTVAPVIKVTAADVEDGIKLPNLENVGVVLPYEKMQKLLSECDASQVLSSGSAPALGSGDVSGDAYLNESAGTNDDLEAELREAMNK